MHIGINLFVFKLYKHLMYRKNVVQFHFDPIQF